MTKTKEIVVLGIIGDERGDACLSAGVVANDSVSVEGALATSALADALVGLAPEVIFAEFMEQILDLFFQKDGKYITRVFLVEYTVKKGELRPTKLAPLDDEFLDIWTKVAGDYVKARSRL